MFFLATIVNVYLYVVVSTRYYNLCFNLVRGDLFPDQEF